MIVVAVAWVIVGIVMVGAVLLADLGRPTVDVQPPRARIHTSMRLLFVSTPGGRVVLDALLYVDGSTTGIPTTWGFACSSNPAIAAATIGALERWAADGEAVDVDLSRTSAPHPSVAFTRDGVLVRLSATHRTGQASEAG